MRLFIRGSLWCSESQSCVVSQWKCWSQCKLCVLSEHLPMRFDVQRRSQCHKLRLFNIYQMYHVSWFNIENLEYLGPPSLGATQAILHQPDGFTVLWDPSQISLQGEGCHIARLAPGVWEWQSQAGESSGKHHGICVVPQLIIFDDHFWESLIGVSRTNAILSALS